ncbi:hypothetical protein [Chromobacterium amazonense]|uniref:hypothetical protein n=1 Tax=Chromobacterium amazonense TaxID=1382803 RepID=UPI0011B22F85|nr:hypothetical protein [Chromobacterium amazonense]
MGNFRKYSKRLFALITFFVLCIFFAYWYGVWPFTRTVTVIQSSLTNQGVVVKFIPSWNVKAPTLFCSFDRDKGRHYTESNETVGRGGPDTAEIDGRTIKIEVVFGKADWKDMSSDEFNRLVSEYDYIYCKVYQANYSSIESEEFSIRLPKAKR